MSMKDSNYTITYRTRDLPACSAVPQPTAPPLIPVNRISSNTKCNMQLMKHLFYMCKLKSNGTKGKSFKTQWRLFTQTCANIKINRRNQPEQTVRTGGGGRGACVQKFTIKGSTRHEYDLRILHI
jgi:hypothetical protein